jgi:ligand-binding sensor domain-containing protein/serine phosphatase RsbU (regulator of sigma subunit)
MKTRRLILLSIVVFSVLFKFQANAQYYKFHQFGVGSICHPFVYSVNQDKNGYIWALTGTGICRFDGFRFKSAFGDSLPESSATVSFKDKNKDLWFGFSDGSLVFYNGLKFKWFKAFEGQTGSINDIVQDAEGNIIAACQGTGIIVINKNFQKVILREPFQSKLLYSLQLNLNNQLLVGTDDGVFLYTYSNSKQIKPVEQIPGLPFSKAQKINYSKRFNGYWVCTEDAGFYLLKAANNKFIVENISAQLKLNMDNIQSVNEDVEGNVWVSTFSKGIYKVLFAKNNQIVQVINYNADNGLGFNDTKCAFQDREGNIWIGTFGNGLATLLNESFISYDFSKYLKSKNISAVCFQNEDFWVGGDNGIIKLDRGIVPKIFTYTNQNGLPADLITGLFIDSLNNLLVGTNKNGVYMLKPGANRLVQFFKADNSIGNSINNISGKGRNIYISTKNGIYQYDIVTKTTIHHSTTEGIRLPHNNIKQVYVAADEGAWVATQSSTVLSLNRSVSLSINVGQELEFTTLTQDFTGNVWAGTNGSGIFKFSNDSFLYFSTREGLKSDYCYASQTDMNGNVWVGHRLGLSRISAKTPHQIKVYGNDYISGDINYNAVSMNPKGDILFGTTDGAVLYEAIIGTKQSVAPMVNIESVTINDKVYTDLSKKIVLNYGHHRLLIEFIGLNYNNPEQVTYKYKLEGFDPDWNETKERAARYSRIDDGNFTFKIMAKSGDGVWTEREVTFELKIRKPIWKTWWFISIIIGIVVVSVYIIIKIREKKQREFQVYLEKLLDERTREVREQKEEIESKNRDITDSINYAQRIQASILPSLRRLQHYFTGSFVYYQPRDIVSGDFYWFDVIPNTNKFIVVCADSTGHGVPGAFMSLIGTTLLKDIFNRPDVKKPSDILRHLDNELKSTLNQNIDGERPNDGMDIIVCEIDITNFKASFASAMRPFIVYQNGEQLYYKGSRSSIGGQIKEEKIFEDVELQLTKGDLIYMFSDGYPDQFGGPLGKKFKMVRLRNLLKDIHQKPMEEQYNYVKSNFELWQGQLDQVDDVIFMGIKI